MTSLVSQRVKTSSGICGCLTTCLDLFLLFSFLASFLLIELNVEGSGQRLVDVDVYVPQSFRPFHNIGSRIGIHTEWSLTTVKIQNIVTNKLDQIIKIDDLAKLYDNLTNSLEFVPDSEHSIEPSTTPCPDDGEAGACNPVLQIIKTIQRSTHILKYSLDAASYAFGAASALYILFLALRSPRLEFKRRLSDENTALQLPLRSSEERQMSADRFEDPAGPGKLDAFAYICYRMAVILGMLSCLGLCMTVVTHYDDILGNVQKILPMLIKKLSWICLTHNTEECQIVYTLQPQVFALVGTLATVFLLALTTTAIRF